MADGFPCFRVLEGQRISASSLLYACLASLVTYAALLLLPMHAVRLSLPPIPIRQNLQASGQSFGTPTPTVILSVSPPNPGPGSMVSLHATVLPVGDGPTPTGSIRFFDGQNALTDMEPGTLRDGSVTIHARLSSSASHTLWALYYGDARYTAANSLEGQQ
jgi:hypothetical protein